MAYWIVKCLLTPIFRFFWRVKVEGLEHVPGTGGAILAGNHLAVFDSFFLPLVVKRRMTFVAKAEYFEDPKTAWFFRAVGQIPIKRGGGSASQRALESAREVLEGGQLFGIYPEGTRSPDGRLYRGKTGVARLAIESGAPVIPVAMVGTNIAQPIGRRIPKVMRIGIVIGEPLDFSRYRGMESDRFILRSVTDEIMYALMSLSGQEYVDVYAATQKARIASGHAQGTEAAQPPVAAPGGRPAPEVHVPVPPEDEAGPSVG